MNRVVDVWYALKTATWFLLVPLAAQALFNLYRFGAFFHSGWSFLPHGLIFIAFLYVPFRVFQMIGQGIVYDEDTNGIEIPGSDTDMSIFDIITFKTVRQMLTREVLPLDEILGLNNHVIRGNGEWYSSTHWILIVSGDFGSRQIRFASKAKRDEARVMIRKLVKEIEQDTQFDQVEYA